VSCEKVTSSLMESARGVVSSRGAWATDVVRKAATHARRGTTWMKETAHLALKRFQAVMNADLQICAPNALVLTWGLTMESASVEKACLIKSQTLWLVPATARKIITWPQEVARRVNIWFPAARLATLRTSTLASPSTPKPVWPMTLSFWHVTDVSHPTTWSQVRLKSPSLASIARRSTPIVQIAVFLAIPVSAATRLLSWPQILSLSLAHLVTNSSQIA